MIAHTFAHHGAFNKVRVCGKNQVQNVAVPCGVFNTLALRVATYHIQQCSIYCGSVLCIIVHVVLIFIIAWVPVKVRKIKSPQ